MGVENQAQAHSAGHPPGIGQRRAEGAPQAPPAPSPQHWPWPSALKLLALALALSHQTPGLVLA
ncbi:hypothetical protein, partial [Streptomyces niveiscabiei]|uniref:hypothetical protein n=1 Tax=Streptomyces niveiscabiei TaxID=164115 RepID=UPI00197DB973